MPALDRLKEHLGEIIDAQGVYHDLSKAAFDAFTIRHPGTTKHLDERLINAPLKTGIAALAKKFNIAPAVYDTDDAMQTAKNLARYLGTKIVSAVGTEVAVATTAAEIAIGLPGIAIVALEIAVEWAVENWGKKTEEPTFGRGDWVIIDKGQKTDKVIDREIDLGMGMMFGDSPDISEIHTLVRVDDYHVGFYVSAGGEPGTVTVFDILTGLVEQHVVSDVRLLPTVQRVALDQDEYVSKVREPYFTKKDHVMFECEVSCDPGTEVILNDTLYNIVSCDGDRALIEDQDGNRESVGMAVLSRSRQERVGKAHIYKEGKPVENTGFVTTGDGFGAGDWVWYKYDTSWYLGVVHIINGEDIVCYLAPTGLRQVAYQGQLRVATREDCDVFQRIRNFMLFKLAAVEGGDTERLRVPHVYNNLMITSDPTARHEPIPGGYDLSFNRKKVGEESVESQATAGEVDDLIELQDKYSLPLSGEFVGIVEGREEEEFGMYGGEELDEPEIREAIVMMETETGGYEPESSYSFGGPSKAFNFEIHPLAAFAGIGVLLFLGPYLFPKSWQF